MRSGSAPAPRRRASRRSAEVASAVPLLAKATPFIGHFQIRNRGTLGGSIAHADPAAEYPAVALALDASMEVVSPNGRRTHRGARLLRRALEHDHGARRAARRRVVPDLGRAQRLRRRGVRAPPRRLRDRRRHDRRRARRRRPDPALRDRPDRPRLDAASERTRPRRSSRAARSPTSSRRRSVAWRWRAWRRSPTDLHGSAAYRKRVGAAMVARAWTTAASAEARRWVRCRCS